MSWFVKRVAIFLLILDQLSRTFQKSAIKPRTLSSSRLKRLADSTDYDKFRTFLSPILRSRVPGSNGHHSVKRHIIKFFKDLHWQVDVDEFDKDTVIGRKRFTNIIATANPNAEKFVLLTAHYDSKIMMSESNQNQEFLAASDSAVPCAMIMSIANSLHLNELMKNKNHSLQVVFFDGEEAFLNWNDNDSIYGSTHLAKLWSEPDGNGNTHLSSIEFLMLLDLLGEPNPRFYSGFPETHVYFERLCSIETRLRRENKLKSGQKEYFVKGVLPQSLGVEDDHIPFLRKGVPILHIIPIPFPKCWHKMCDDGKNIDETTVHDLLKIFQAFFREILRV